MLGASTGGIAYMLSSDFLKLTLLSCLAAFPVSAWMMYIRFEYEWHDAAGQWYCSYGNELWEFDENGLMRKRFASINDLEIEEKDRKLK